MDDLRGALALMPDAALLAEPQGRLTAEAVLRAADRAMYEAKRAGRNRFVVT